MGKVRDLRALEFPLQEVTTDTAHSVSRRDVVRPERERLPLRVRSLQIVRMRVHRSQRRSRGLG